MPYSEDFCGIYVIKNEVTRRSYLGQSTRMRKRISDHFNLLRRGDHPNQHLQRSFNKYGEASFSYDFEVVCEDASELDMIEEAFLSGAASYDESPVWYNISKSAHVPMRGRVHSDVTRSKISAAKTGRSDHVTDAYRKRLSEAQMRRALRNPKKVAVIKYIVDNPHMTYAERGRVVGLDLSSVRKIALRSTPLREFFDGPN